MSVKTTILKLILVATMHFYELQVTAKKCVGNNYTKLGQTLFFTKRNFLKLSF